MDNSESTRGSVATGLGQSLFGNAVTPGLWNNTSPEWNLRKGIAHVTSPGNLMTPIKGRLCEGRFSGF